MAEVAKSSHRVKQRLIWKRSINRVLTFILNTALWFGLWLGAVVGLFMAVRTFSNSAWLNSLTGTTQSVAEIGVRGVMAIPLSLWLLLMIHPIRTRWWLVRQLWRGIALVRRTLGQPRPSIKADGQAVSSESAARNKTVAIAMPDAGLLQPTRPPRLLTRRRFLAESGLFGGLVTYSMFIEPYALQAVELDIPVANLPDRFVGMRVAQVSDLHVNSYTTAEDVARAVEMVNTLQPDVVMLTGDFVDWEAQYSDDATRPFRKLVAPEGVFSVLGNHDYYSADVERVKRAIKHHDLGLLVNQHTTIRRGADTLTIIGLDDPRHHRNGNGPRMSSESIDPDRAMRGMPTAGPRLLMVHNPIIVPALVRQYELDLIMCGHTHGGQFQVPILTDSLVESAEYFVQGRYDLGRTQLYVNRGFGFTGPPIRFRVRPEVTLMRLVRA